MDQAYFSRFHRFFSFFRDTDIYIFFSINQIKLHRKIVSLFFSNLIKWSLKSSRNYSPYKTKCYRQTLYRAFKPPQRDSMKRNVCNIENRYFCWRRKKVYRTKCNIRWFSARNESVKSFHERDRGVLIRVEPTNYRRVVNDLTAW